MSLFKYGWFNVLPSELRAMLFAYYFNQVGEYIELSTDYQKSLINEDAQHRAEKTLSSIKYQQFVDCDSVYFDILIVVPSPLSRILYFPFKVYLAPLGIFLEKYLKFNKPSFLTIDKLLPLKTSNKFLGLKFNNSIQNNMNYAKIGQLINDKEGINIFLYEIAGEIGIYYNTNEEDHPLYELTDVQGELLIYKLVKFYNDIISIAETNNILRSEY